MTPDEALKVVYQTRSIQGWLSPEAALLFAWIDDIQKAHGIEGDLFEIGVHHGKSAMLVGAMARVGLERLGVCDLFGDQAANVSVSGRGDLDIFERNARRFLRKELDLRIFRKLSSALTPDEIGLRHRFFHVDGGHNADEAEGDMRLAAECLVPGGVIAVDDALRSEWPAVTEGIIRFLDRCPEFRPLALGFNKMLLTRGEHADRFAAEFDKPASREAFNLGYPWRLKVLPFVGESLRIFYLPSFLKRPTRTMAMRAYYHGNDWLHAPVLGPFVRGARTLLRTVR
jgi:Methyltransferase domain